MELTSIVEREDPNTHFTLRMPAYHIYIVRCRDGSLYTGWTNDVEARVAQHNAGKGAKYTRSRLPVTLVYSQAYSSKAEALRGEREIKKLTRAQKIRLAGLYAFAPSSPPSTAGRASPEGGRKRRVSD